VPIVSFPFWPLPIVCSYLSSILSQNKSSQPVHTNGAIDIGKVTTKPWYMIHLLAKSLLSLLYYISDHCRGKRVPVWSWKLPHPEYLRQWWNRNRLIKTDRVARFVVIG